MESVVEEVSWSGVDKPGVSQNIHYPRRRSGSGDE